MDAIYFEFIGNPVEHTIRAREEFLKMKCCSFQRKDLERHYNRMSERFYCLQGVDDVNLKQVFLNSFPESLGNEAYRSLETRNVTVAQTSLGGLYQLILTALEKLCNQKKFLYEFEKTGKRLGTSCSDKHLQIKCKDKSSCDCSHTKKKSHFKEFSRKTNSYGRKKWSPRQRSHKKKWKFFRKKNQRGRNSDKCYVCHKKGHFAKDCPNNRKAQAVIQALNKIEPIDLSDIESIYSLDDEPNEFSLCSIAYSDDSDEESESDSDNEHSDIEVFVINPDPVEHIHPEVFRISPVPEQDDVEVFEASPIPHIRSPIPVRENQPTPAAKIHLLTSTYAKPIQAIGFFDTGSAVSILNPKILSQDFWKPHYQQFLAANGETFAIDKISIPINIRLFPKLVVKHRMLGSSAHGKDIIIGFDILHKLSNLRWTEKGLCYKSFMNPWTNIPRLFLASTHTHSYTLESLRHDIIQSCCANSHTEFLSKHPNPLWLNPSFFVSLPFKQNEDINPTKASHPGMNPDHYQLALEECNQLVDQGIIEPTTSPWACEAFYVNKRSEQIRGKLRLVINYQPLNHFLADDKFPLPQKKSLFQSLVNAKVLSKFDLKSGFWQLGITPNDRPKTGFCIPDHHYQWKVMPFGLKNAPSAFQKAMIKIFEPILSNTLVYIDDILLFSHDEDSHVELLSKFYSLVKKNGIMLSEKKMEIGVSTIDFLGMKISDGKYQPQSHIAQELHKFPDELTTPKMIQQFLGLVNYMADFLPKLSSHTVWLFPMLKKDSPPWTTKQTTAVKEIKKLADVMPPLKIPAPTEKRILQTDASDEYWGAVLLVQDKDNVRSVCGYKSGTFKDSEKHYHSTFKEILAVKRGIERFQFHLVGHDFEIEMDMSSFPKMLQFKKKILPEGQLLRWSRWFSQWKFTVKHIKGTENILADFLSRPKDYLKKRSSSITIKPTHNPGVIPMVYTVTSNPVTPNPTDDHVSSSNTLPSPLPLPEFITETIADLTFQERSQLNYQIFLTILIRNHGLSIKGLKFHPDYPYLSLFHIHNLFRLSKEALCFFWYLFESYTIGISFNVEKLLSYIIQCQFESVSLYSRNLFTLLQWFLPPHQWLQKISYGKPYVVILFRRPCSYFTPSMVRQPHSIVYHTPTVVVQDYYYRNPIMKPSSFIYPIDQMRVRRAIAQANEVNPETIPIHIMEDMCAWSDDHPVSSKWIEALDEWKKDHLTVRIDTSEEEAVFEDEDDEDQESDEDTSHFDPYEDDPSHPDSRWK